MRLLAPLLALALVQSAAAATHTLELSIAQGKTVFVKRLRLAAKRNFQHSGPVTAQNGTRRQLIFNVLMNERDDGLELQYQTELSGGRKSKERSIQVQGGVLMRPGERMTAARCGPWKVRLVLDPPRKGAKTVSNWKRGNYRVSAKLGGKKSGLSCSQILRAGSQGNVVYGIPRGDKKFGDIMNMMLMVTPGGVAALQYQLEHSRPGRGKPTQLQGDRRLSLGKPDISGGGAGRLELLVEGRPPEPAKKAEPKKPLERKADGGAFPLLR